MVFETNLFNAATRLVSLRISLTILGEVMSSMALTFFGFTLIPRFSKYRMFLGGFGFLAFHDHVVHIDLHIPAYLLAEHLVYQSLVRCTCVLQPKQHDFVAIQALASDECSFFLIFLLH